MAAQKQNLLKDFQQTETKIRKKKIKQPEAVQGQQGEK